RRELRAVIVRRRGRGRGRWYGADRSVQPALTPGAASAPAIDHGEGDGEHGDERKVRDRENGCEGAANAEDDRSRSHHRHRADPDDGERPGEYGIVPLIAGHRPPTLQGGRRARVAHRTPPGDRKRCDRDAGTGEEAVAHVSWTVFAQEHP